MPFPPAHPPFSSFLADMKPVEDLRGFVVGGVGCFLGGARGGWVGWLGVLSCSDGSSDVSLHP